MASVEAESRLSSSQTLSSGLHVQNELLNELATLRSALARSNQQLEKAYAAGYMSSSSGRLTPSLDTRRDRRVTLPAGSSPAQNIAARQQHGGNHNNHRSISNTGRLSMSSTTASKAAEQRHRRNSSAIVPSAASSMTSDNHQSSSTAAGSGSRATPSTSRPAATHTTPRSASISGSALGYTGAPPSSLATPTSASVPAFSLKRDAAYDDLARVMNAPSPNPASRTMNGLGISSPPPHRRTSSLNSNGTPISTSKVPMPAIPPGSVGTATALAGGSNSPKTPLSATDKSFDCTPVRPKIQTNGGHDVHALPDRVLRDSTNAATRSSSKHSGSPGDDSEKISSSASSTLGLPPLPQHIPSGVRSPHLSSDGEGEYSPTTTMNSTDDEPKLPTRRQSKSSAGASRGGSSPFFGGSAGFTERHGGLAPLCPQLFNH